MRPARRIPLPSATAAPRPSDIKAVCEQVVLEFTEGNPVSLVGLINETNEDLKDQYLGDYVFKDDTYQYIVDADELYIRCIDMKPELLEGELLKPETVSGDSGENLALEIFNKVLSDFFVEDGEVTALYTSPPRYDGCEAIDVQERINCVPTGNRARICISQSNVFLGGIFYKGSREQAENAQMISAESAEQTALEEVNSMVAELNVENIRIDDSEPCKIMTLGDMTVWAVQFRYSKWNDDSYGGIVMIDAFSGEVFRVYLYA